MPEFHRPESLGEMISCLQSLGKHDRLIAGGTDLLCREPLIFDANCCLVDVTALPELRQIELQQDQLLIGAALTHRELAENALLAEYFPALAIAAAGIGSAQIRNRGTIGGNVVTASPAGDLIAVLWLYQARVECLNATGQKRQMPLSAFITGSGQTSLKSQELVSGFYLPLPKEPSNSAFVKLGYRRKVAIANINLALQVLYNDWTAQDWRKADTLAALDIVVASIMPTPVWLRYDGKELIRFRLYQALWKDIEDKIVALIDEYTPPEYGRDYKRTIISAVIADAFAALDCNTTNYIKIR